MRHFFRWYCRLSPWYQAVLSALYYAIIMAVGGAAAMGTLGGAIAGLFLGLVLGPIFFYGDYRDRKRAPDVFEPVEEYPDELAQVEARHSKQVLILIPMALAIGIGLSWIFFGTGIYGAAIAGLAVVFGPYALARFGGPDSPRWRKLREEWWERQRALRNRDPMTGDP